jgi:hypothetical protein
MYVGRCRNDKIEKKQLLFLFIFFCLPARLVIALNPNKIVCLLISIGFIFSIIIEVNKLVEVK